MFKKGGKLNYLVNKFKNGGKKTIDTPKGPIHSDGEGGYKDIDGRDAGYREGYFKERAAQRASDRLAEQEFRSDSTYHALPGGPIYTRSTFYPFSTDTLVSKDGKFYSNSLGRSIRKFVTGTSPFDQINRAIDSIAGYSTPRYDNGGEIRSDDRSAVRKFLDNIATKYNSSSFGNSAVAEVLASTTPYGLFHYGIQGNKDTALLSVVPFGATIKTGAKTAKAGARAIRVIPEGVSDASEAARAARNNKAAKIQSRQHQYMEQRYGPDLDANIGDRGQHFSKSGSSESIYPTNKDLTIPDYELDAVSRNYGNWNPLGGYKYISDGGYTSNTSQFSLSDFLRSGGKLNLK